MNDRSNEKHLKRSRRLVEYGRKILLVQASLGRTEKVHFRVSAVGHTYGTLGLGLYFRIIDLSSGLISGTITRPPIQIETRPAERYIQHLSKQSSINHRNRSPPITQSKPERSQSPGSSTTGTISEPEVLTSLQPAHERPSSTTISSNVVEKLPLKQLIKLRLPIYQQQIEQQQANPAAFDPFHHSLQSIQPKPRLNPELTRATLKRPSTTFRPASKRPCLETLDKTQNLKHSCRSITSSQTRPAAVATPNQNPVTPSSFSTLQPPLSTNTKALSTSKFTNPPGLEAERRYEPVAPKPFRRRQKRTFDMPEPYDPERPRTRDQFRRRQEEYNKPPSPFTSLEVMQAKGEWAGRRLL